MERTIKVFISSTFQDMQSERDFLIYKVFPKIKDYCSKKDILFSEIDLRWGITEEESKNKKVIELCLQEIDNTYPFLIGLLGDRYGWIPTMDDIAYNRNFIENYPWIEKDISNRLSLTEIEMRYGALRSTYKMNAMFFIRSSQRTDDSIVFEPEEKRKKLEQLKSDILSQKKYPVYCYSDLDTLGLTLERQFIVLINHLFPDKPLSAFEKIQQAQKNFINSRTNIYVSENNLIDKLNDFVFSPDTKLVIKGRRGYGKSALLANWMVNNTNNIFDIIPYFIGFNVLETNPNQILDYLNHSIMQRFNFPEIAFLCEKTVSLAEKKKKCEKALTVLQSKGKKIVLLIDGIDQLSVEDDIEKIIWLPVISCGNTIIISIEENDPAIVNLRELGYGMLEMHPMSVVDKEICIRKILAIYGKKLPPQQVSLITQNDLCASPLILTTLLNEIITFGIYEKLDERLAFYLSANSEKDFFHKILIRLENIFGENQTNGIFSAISESLRGLSAKEIQEIYNIPQLEWSYFYYACKYFFIERNGLLTFYHNIFKEAVMERYYAPGEAQGELVGQHWTNIMECFRNQLIQGTISCQLRPKDGEHYIDNYLHKAEELLYQLRGHCWDDIEENHIKLLVRDNDIYSYLLNNNPFMLSELLIDIARWYYGNCEDEFIENEPCRIKFEIKRLHDDLQLDECVKRVQLYLNIDMNIYFSLGEFAFQLCRKKMQQKGNDRLVIQTYINLLIMYGQSYFLYNQHQKANNCFLKATSLAMYLQKEDNEKYMEYLFKFHWFRGDYYCVLKKPEEAKIQYIKARRIYQKQAAGPYYAYLNYAGLLLSYARFEIVYGSVNQALKLLNESYRHLFDFVFDKYDEVRYFQLNCLCHYTYCYILQNNYIKTQQLYEKILTLYFQWHGGRFYDLFGSMVKTLLEICLLSKKNPNAAIKKIKSIRKIDRRSYGKDYFASEINEMLWELKSYKR